MFLVAMCQQAPVERLAATLVALQHGQSPHGWEVYPVWWGKAEKNDLPSGDLT